MIRVSRAVRQLAILPVTAVQRLAKALVSVLCQGLIISRRRAVLALLAVGVPWYASATAAAVTCDAAAEVAAAETGVPLSVLRAVTRVETGRARDGRLEPWPWTVNMEGVGHWFQTRDKAIEYVTVQIDRGARIFDVGCFQINYRWHGHQFHSVEHMFDPMANARYAARFLSRLYGETGNWSEAAGAYHSRTPALAKRYRARFDAVLAQLLPADLPDRRLADSAQTGRSLRDNSFPLLSSGAARSDSAGRIGSLVPETAAGAGMFRDLTQRRGSL